MQPISDRFFVTQAVLYLCAAMLAIQGFGFESMVVHFGLWPIHEASSEIHGQFHIYQLVTYGFLHGSIAHLVINGLLLWMFGRVMELVWGARAYLLVLASALLVSGLAHLAAGLFGLAMGDQGVIGFSGAVAAILAAYAVQFPKSKMLLLLPPIPMYAPVAVAGLLAIDVILALAGFNGVSHAAHWGGALVGLIAGLMLRVKMPVRTKLA